MIFIVYILSFMLFVFTNATPILPSVQPLPQGFSNSDSDFILDPYGSFYSTDESVHETAKESSSTSSLLPESLGSSPIGEAKKTIFSKAKPSLQQDDHQDDDAVSSTRRKNSEKSLRKIQRKQLKTRLRNVQAEIKRIKQLHPTLH